MRFRLLLVACSLMASNAFAEKIDLRFLGSQGDYIFMSVPASHAKNKAYIEHVAKGMCLNKTHCYVGIWENGKNAAARLPMTDAQVRSQLAQYDYNRQTGRDRLLWNCKMFKDAPKNECFSPP